MSFLIDSLIFVCVVFMILRFRRKTSFRRLPPGPKPLPVIGNLHLLGDKPHVSTAKLSEKYGPLMTLQLGQVTTVIVSSSDMAKEILQTHDRVCSGRSIPDAMTVHDHSKHGMTWHDVSNKWRNLRKIGNNYIFTTVKLEARQDLRRKKVDELLQEVGNCCREGKSVDIAQAAFRTTLNLLSNTFFSVDLADTSSENAREFKDAVKSIMEVVAKPNLSDHFPILRFLDPQGIRRETGVLCQKLLDIFDGILDERLRSRKESDRRDKNSDVLDTLLDIAEDKNMDLDLAGIRHLFLELFTAGNDTTSSTLEWAMTELLRNPKAMSRARDELRENIGVGNTVEESDTSRLPYLQAIIKETFRLHPPPFLIPRKSGSDVEINGFVIPKDSKILINAWAIGRDPKIWENPESFIPERFLESDIDVRGSSFRLIPFGGGRRICPGLPLASRMLHLMLGSLIHSFEWAVEDDDCLGVEEVFGLTVHKARGLRALPIRGVVG
ncbi:PREDICTED: geraniol 8-hydroxylase-like [Tarenaya hassleriana]|uniref:geraniol 8-hydroxylase-like n=1 Tax=Tarenaya hassleriana TaxID=28532 RepID=UPI00053CA224|nr:PREDICTED: geraniol 8-hydroxylase-like [Tarenaya hassleriana]